MPKKYYSLETNGDNAAELYIFGDITSWPWLESDVSANGLVKELQKLDAKEINVHINSYGGEVAEGLAIYNILNNSNMKVTTICDGFACSAASVIFMAGDERIINEASLLMIHNAWSCACGDSAKLRKEAEDLDKITQASVNAYMNRVNITEDEVKDLMDKETWITAEEAVSYGFATKTEKSEEGGVSQSAFECIRKAILEKEIEPAQMTGILKTPELNQQIDTEDLAEKVVEKLSLLFKTEQQKGQNDGTGWGAFFS